MTMKGKCHTSNTIRSLPSMHRYTIPCLTTGNSTFGFLILLDNESTMDLFCNKHFVTGVAKSYDSVTVTGNGGTLVVKQKATLNGYHTKIWFDKRAITNILALANVAKQYCVTYDSGDTKGFVVHRAKFGLPDMRFELHRSGLHIYNPKEEQLTFVNTVKDNMEAFTKRQIVGAQEARTLYAKLAYPSMKDPATKFKIAL
jgi:hypothetical protein